MLNKAKRLHNDKSGSETIEFLATFGILLLVVMTLITLISYVYRVSQLDYAGRRAVRSIEIAGTYDAAATQTLVNKLFPGDTPVKITCTDAVGGVITNGKKIQLRDTFKLNLSSKYELRLLTVGKEALITVPIVTSTQGMSEVYDQEGP